MKLFGFTLKMWADDGVEPFPSLIREGPPFHTSRVCLPTLFQMPRLKSSLAGSTRATSLVGACSLPNLRPSSYTRKLVLRCKVKTRLSQNVGQPQKIIISVRITCFLPRTSAPPANACDGFRQPAIGVQESLSENCGSRNEC